MIGTLATGAGMPVDIVTGDRDLFQLVDDEQEVRVLYVARGVGSTSGSPTASSGRSTASTANQYADFATLRGDASDGLPGVAGVGDKTAASLLRKFGDMAGIRAAADDPDSDLAPGPRRKITDAADYLAVAPAVVAVARDIDFGEPDLELPLTPVDPARLTALSEQWGLDSPAARLVETLTSLRS